jgi:hypothetical protein
MPGEPRPQPDEQIRLTAIDQKRTKVSKWFKKVGEEMIWRREGFLKESLKVAREVQKYFASNEAKNLDQKELREKADALYAEVEGIFRQLKAIEGVWKGDYIFFNSEIQIKPSYGDEELGRLEERLKQGITHCRETFQKRIQEGGSFNWLFEQIRSVEQKIRFLHQNAGRYLPADFYDSLPKPPQLPSGGVQYFEELLKEISSLEQEPI